MYTKYLVSFYYELYDKTSDENSIISGWNIIVVVQLFKCRMNNGPGINFKL